MLFDLHLFQLIQNWHFWVLVFIHKAKVSLRIVFQKSVGMPKIDVETTDLFINLIIGDAMYMNKSFPWWGEKMKDYKQIKVLMKAMTKPRAMAPDAYASTWDYNHFLLIISILEHVLGTLLIDGVHCGF